MLSQPLISDFEFDKLLAELQKLEAKYQNRKDPDSERAKQMEQMRIYKKYKMVGAGMR